MSTITPRLVSLALFLSVGCGILFFLWAHFILEFFGVSGFAAIPQVGSTIRIALVGGAFTTLPVLALLTIPIGLDELFEYRTPYFLFFVAVLLIGAVQGCIGAMLWKGKVYTVVDGEAIPGVLGVGNATLAGVLGAWLLVGNLSNFVMIRGYFFPKKKSLQAQARLLDTELEEAEKEPAATASRL